jgi:hypothetical protein
MFVAPLTLPASVTPSSKQPRPRSSARTPVITRGPEPLLLAWLLLGAAALCLVPELRGGEFSGASLPFWLVAAPALDLAWLMRARMLSALRSGAQTLRGRRARNQARRVARIQSGLVMRAERSSRK